MQTSVASSSDGRLPVIIGVSGHRDLHPQDRDIITERVQRELRKFHEQYPNTPLIVMCALAEGADRLVAEIGLNLGASLAVVLPRALESYRKDFVSEQSQKEFAELLERASSCVVAPKISGIEDPDGYVSQGMHIALESHMVLALWDGGPRGGEGGTEHVVRMCLDGLPTLSAEGSSVLDPPETRPVLWIKVRRANENNPTDIGKVHELLPGPKNFWPKARKAYRQMLRNVGEFNHGFVSAAHLSELQQRSLHEVLPDAVQKRLAPPVFQLATQYARADALARIMQSRMKWAMSLVIGFSWGAAICATAESWERLLRGVPGLSPPMIDWAFIFCALAAAAVYVWQAGRKYQTHHLDCRALAEGLRVQLFWSIAGVRECVADHYLRKHRGELEWIRSAIRAATINVNCHTTENVSPPRAIEIVEKYWIDSQENFFKRKGESQHHTAHRVGLFLHVSLVIGFVAELVKAIVHRHPDAQVPVQLDGAIAAAEALVATAGALKIAVKTLALAEQSKQYERMATIFATARTRLKGGDADQAIFSELGREALTENADWLLLHRQRPLEMPAA